MDLMLDKKEQYKIYDDYLSIQNYQMIWEFVKDAPYKHGEVDYQGSYPIGMVHELDVNESFGFPTEVDGIDYSHINFPFPRQVNGCPLSRAYINYYGPRELAVFHIDDKDDDSVTLLYYPCPTLSYDEGGTTELMLDNQIVGDVKFDEVESKAKAVTPVPGGVGPMTIACLLSNTLECFKVR